MNIKKVALVIAFYCFIFYSGYSLGVHYERSKHLTATVESAVKITKENQEALKKSVEISESTSEKVQKETEVVNEQKQRVAKAKADADILRSNLPTSIIGVLHDASSR